MNTERKLCPFMGFAPCDPDGCALGVNEDMGLECGLTYSARKMLESINEEERKALFDVAKEEKTVE